MAKIIEAKRDGRELPEAPEPERPGEVLDLMAALNESVAQAKVSRGEGSKPKPKPKAATKKATARKQPAKKTAGKKASARQPSSA
ncbi:hypothetical protein ABT150_30025 [Streptomyces mirabilis]|uniref:hypothetical protein n=1 Tax=Streptomyces mirabilis TaxID=68239 RepID=UPI00331EC229